MQFHAEIGKILFCKNPEEKIEKFAKFYAKFCENSVEFESEFEPKPLVTPSYDEICTTINMRDLKRPKSDKMAFFLHSIAHIEYNAIDIALDACYRFLGLPREFYADWLEVAEDEIRHFEMIENELKKYGHDYGDFVAHDGLFKALQKTQNSLVERMAVVPRFMEANGLDANFFMINKNRKNPEFKDIIKILEVILEEEVSHVFKGDKWFKFACEKFGEDPENYLKIVLKHYPNSFRTKREINVSDRKRAGFSDAEIEKLFELQRKKMKKIYFIRHAKAEKLGPSDFDRKLSERGKSDAKFMASKIAFLPDMIFASGAKRAKKTAKIIAKEIGFGADKIEFSNEIYYSTSQNLLNFIHGVDDKFQTIFIVGHNPEFTEICELLSDSSIGNIPTCGIFGIEFDADSFKKVKFGAGKVIFFDYPKKETK